MKPIIGISTEEIPYLRGLKSFMNHGYGDAICKAGGSPVLLQIVHDNPEEHAENVARSLDGLVISGGMCYIDPQFYGEGMSPDMSHLYPPRDYWERALIKAFMKAGKPVIGVCRGMQQINVLMGGSMHGNVLKDIPGAHNHWGGDTQMHFPAHNIDIDKDSHLHQISGKEVCAVNSFHYQAINKVGNDLKVTARSSLDGVIEAIEHTDSNVYLHGYQFHPEMMVDNEPLCMDIFKALVKKSAEVASR